MKERDDVDTKGKGQIHDTDELANLLALIGAESIQPLPITIARRKAAIFPLRDVKMQKEYVQKDADCNTAAHLETLRKHIEWTM